MSQCVRFQNSGFKTLEALGFKKKRTLDTVPLSIATAELKNKAEHEHNF